MQRLCRRLVRALSIATLILWNGAATTPACAADDLIATTVTWTSQTGQTGTVLFQARVNGKTLTGRIYAGDAALVANGTIDAAGHISGTMTTSDGAVVGTFSGERDTPAVVEGAYATSGTSGGTFAAPAEKLPTPAE